MSEDNKRFSTTQGGTVEIDLAKPQSIADAIGLVGQRIIDSKSDDSLAVGLAVKAMSVAVSTLTADFERQGLTEKPEWPGHFVNSLINAFATALTIYVSTYAKAHNASKESIAISSVEMCKDFSEVFLRSVGQNTGAIDFDAMVAKAQAKYGKPRGESSVPNVPRNKMH